MWQYKNKNFGASSLQALVTHEGRNWARVVKKLPFAPPEHERALNFIHGFDSKVVKNISTLLAKKHIDSYNLTMNIVIDLAHRTFESNLTSANLNDKICIQCTLPPLAPLARSPVTEQEYYWPAPAPQPLPSAPVGPCAVHPKAHDHTTATCKAVQFEYDVCKSFLYEGFCKDSSSCNYA